MLPGVGTLSPTEWFDDSGCWLEKLQVDCGRQVQVWKYEYATKPIETSVLEQLLEEGRSLLACLDTLCAKNNVRL